jgi:hypothetical protein
MAEADDRAEDAGGGSGGEKARGVRVTIHTNLPDHLPVLPGEVALIRAFLGELVARLAANDNGDES